MLDYDRFIAGFTGGLALQMLHPLDLIKTRLQSVDGTKFINTRQYTSYKDAIKSIIQQEGKLGLFKGMWFSMFTNILIGSFFMVNDKLKRRLKKREFFERHPGIEAFTSAFGVSFLFSLFATPFYVIKTWKLLESNNINVTPSAFKIVKEIKKTHGYIGFYRGFITMTVMGVNGTITVGLNDYLKLSFPEFYSTGMGNFLLGGTSRLVSSTILYPFSTIRTRMMQNQVFEGLNEPKYKSIKDCVKKTYTQEGYQGFFKGYMANASRSFLSSALLFTIYENTYRYLKDRKSSH